MPKPTLTKAAPNFLIPGAEYLAANFPDFKLEGRQEELLGALDVLTRHSDMDNLVVYGPNGVGLSSIIAGIQASKEDPATPDAIARKHFFYLDTDALFALGNPETIKQEFQKTLDVVQKQESVLIINNTKGFLEGVQNNGAVSIVNALMRAVRTNPNFQLIFESADTDVPFLLRAHEDIAKNFALQGIDPPTKDNLKAIVTSGAKKLEKTYGIKISKEALTSVEKLTKKYPGLSVRLGVAQPKLSLVILEGALNSYRRMAASRPAGLDGLEETLVKVNDALNGKTVEPDLADKSHDELVAMKLTTEKSIEELNDGFGAVQTQILDLRKQQMQATKEIASIDRGIAEYVAQRQAKSNKQQSKSDILREAQKQYLTADADTQKKIRKEYEDKTGETFAPATAQQLANVDRFNVFAGVGAEEFTKDEITERARADREKAQARLDEARKAYDKIIASNQKEGSDLILKDDNVVAEFSRLSSIEMNKLQQDEREKLLKLPETLRSRVFGQDPAVLALASAVQRGRSGLKKPDVPVGSFLFLGPSGVGKTELAKALADALYGTERALHTFNMPEYKMENDVTKLLGSPPGYQGYDAGGKLTNSMFDTPSCVNLFDEIEKAHIDIFDILLRVVDEGKVEDNHGREATFGDAVNIFTSNIGSQYFLDEKLSFEEACQKAKADLVRHVDTKSGKEIGLRPEFINRLDGVFYFNRLGDGQIQLIALKSIKELNQWVADADKELTIQMAPNDLAAMCKDQYVPAQGARGVQKYIASNITTDVSTTMLEDPDAKGVIEVSYTPVSEAEKQQIRAEFAEKEAQLTGNNTSATATGISKEEIDEVRENALKAEYRARARVSSRLVPAGKAASAAPVPANSNNQPPVKLAK